MKNILIVLLIISFLALPAVYAQDDNQQTGQDSNSARGEGYNPEYNILPIIISLFIIYLFTYLLFDIKTIKRRTFKRIWSIILLGSFLFSGSSGIVLTLLSDYKLQFPLDFNLLFWHVELSVIMAITLIFHIHIHWKATKKFIMGSFQK